MTDKKPKLNPQGQNSLRVIIQLNCEQARQPIYKIWEVQEKPNGKSIRTLFMDEGFRQWTLNQLHKNMKHMSEVLEDETDKALHPYNRAVPPKKGKAVNMKGNDVPKA